MRPITGRPDGDILWRYVEILFMGIILAPIVCLSSIVMMDMFTAGVSAETYNVEAYVEQVDRDTVSVTYLGGEDQNKVIHVWVTIDGKFFPEGASEGSFISLDTFGGDGVSTIPVGKTVLITDTSGVHVTDRQDHVKVFAEFDDLTIKCLVDTEL